MKIVLIGQRCYPALTPRSLRITELAKELARRGHEVIIYALLGADFDYTKFSSETGVIFKNLGISRFGLENSSGYRNRNILNRAFKYMFNKYLLFPEVELYSKVKRAIESEGEIDLLITVAYPHIIHYSAARSNLDNIKYWIADCGDPFMGNQFLKFPSYFEKFERYWCERCNYITIPIIDGINGYYKEYRDKLRIISQGFDFSDINIAKYEKNEIPVFAYSGNLFKELRDPTLLLEYLCTLDYDFKFIVYTKTKSLFDGYIDKLGRKLILNGFIPRENLLYELSKVDFLINLTNESSVQQPSKLIDYGIVNRPILDISSKFSNEQKSNFDNFVNGDYSKQHVIEDFDQYNIKNVADKFIALLK